MDKHKLSIFPQEIITYNKETQTHNIYDLECDTQNTNLKNQSSKNKTKKEKPLAYYDDIFVYDTLQWEDEYEFNPEEMDQVPDITKQLNVDSLSLIESHLNFKDAYFNDNASITQSLGLYLKKKHHLFVCC